MKNWLILVLGSLGIYHTTTINNLGQAAQKREIFADESPTAIEQELAEDSQQAQEPEELGENLEEDILDLDGAAVTELQMLASQTPPETYTADPL